MSIFKRTFTTLSARIDQFVGQIENHEALIRAAIAEQQGKLARAKIQLRRLQDSELRTQQKIQELNNDEQRWSQRAVKEAGDNEERALTCLQRRQLVQQQLQKLQSMLREYQRNIENLNADIRQCEDSLRNMKQKHEVLRARESTADAVNAIHLSTDRCLEDIEQSFDRWEVKIAQGELFSDSPREGDSLELEYLKKENEQELRSQLAELLLQEKLKSSESTASEFNHQPKKSTKE